MNSKIIVALFIPVIVACVFISTPAPEPRPSPIPTRIQNIPRAPTSTPYYIFVTGNLNFRNVPDETAPGSRVISVIPARSRVEWLGVCMTYNGPWALVLYRGDRGYVSAKWLSILVCSRK